MNERTNIHSPYVCIAYTVTHSHTPTIYRKIIISFVTNKIVFEFIAFVFHLAAIWNFFFLHVLCFSPVVISIDMRYYRSKLCHESMTLFPICWPLWRISEVVCYVFFSIQLILHVFRQGICFDHQKSASIFFFLLFSLYLANGQ